MLRLLLLSVVSPVRGARLLEQILHQGLDLDTATVRVRVRLGLGLRLSCEG